MVKTKRQKQEKINSKFGDILTHTKKTRNKYIIYKYLVLITGFSISLVIIFLYYRLNKQQNILKKPNVTFKYAI
jgi:uncharacterized membrane protein YvbJ